MTVRERMVVEGPVGVDPSRARPAVRELYDRPVLSRRDLTAPLLVHPAGRETGSLPGSVTLPAVGTLIRRWESAGIRGVKVFAFGSPRDGRASGALAADNLMVAAVRRALTGSVATESFFGAPLVRGFLDDRGGLAGARHRTLRLEEER